MKKREYPDELVRRRKQLGLPVLEIKSEQLPQKVCFKNEDGTFDIYWFCLCKNCGELLLDDKKSNLLDLNPEHNKKCFENINND